jgi:uncharacterized membrane protein
MIAAFSARPPENLMRALLKATTWRIVAATTTLTVVYCLTGDVGAAGAAAAIAGTIKMGLYMAHDAVWAKLSAPTVAV